MKITTITTIVALIVLPMASNATEVLVDTPVEYTDSQVIASMIGCAVLFGALASVTAGISTAVGAIAGGSVCAIATGENLIQPTGRIVGYESGA
jgi:hypothetical protein